MVLPCSFALLLFFFLTTTHFSHASSHAHTHHHHLRAAVKQSTTTTANDGGVSVELWCVAKNNADNSALQSALDWACGPGGADCGPIQQGRPCYDPTDILKTASYAFNDYFLKHGLAQDSCNFDGTAALTSLNPSHGSCKFPSSFTAASNGSFTGSSTTVGIGSASADTSGGGYFAGRSWSLITLYLFPIFTLIFC